MSLLRSVLLLEDDLADAAIVRRTLGKLYPQARVEHVVSREQFLAHLDSGTVDIVVSDSTVMGCEGLRAFHLAREHNPHVPFVYLSGSGGPDRDVLGLKALGVSAFLSKHDLEHLGPAIEEALVERERARQSLGLLTGFERLVTVVSALALAHDTAAVMAIVRRAVRDLTDADGATFVLRDGDFCHYADEDAIGPLWKGRRFPLTSCISGWAMIHRQPAVVPDIREDPRTPVSSYEPTFVRSLVMVPIRAMDPIGAIGAYWSERRDPHPQEIRLLQALADATAVAITNARAFEALEARTRQVTADLDAFVYAISHDLRAPVRHVRAFAEMLAEDHAAALGAEMRHTIGRVTHAAERLRAMIDALVQVSGTRHTPVQRAIVDLAEIGRAVAESCADPGGPDVEFVAPITLPVEGDPVLLRMALDHLIGNAWKFSRQHAAPRVEVGTVPGATPVFFVRDNGAGFDDAAAARLFGVFQRLHDVDEFPGTGVGLAIVRNIVQKHGGRIWAESRPGAGATFFFTLSSENGPAGGDGSSDADRVLLQDSDL